MLEMAAAAARERDRPVVRVNHTPGIITLADVNTTVGYCRYNPDGEVEYIFVHPARRRQGYARQMLKLVERTVRRPLSFQSPISPLGRALIDAFEAEHSAEDSLR